MTFGNQYLILISLATAMLPVRAQNAQARYESARNFEEIRRGVVSGARETVLIGGGGDFGTQILRPAQEPRKLTFGASADGGWFYTDNAFFTDDNRLSDNFLATSAGVNTRYVFSPEWEADAFVRGGLYRYDRFGALDFQSLDLGAGLTFLPANSRGTAFYARYSFTELLAHHTRDVFYTNHAATLGAQHSFTFSRAHGLTLGALAQWAWTDPADVQRDDYSLQAGYRVRIARNFTADLLYRLDWFVYREDGDGRRDLRNSLTLSLRYELSDAWALTALGFYSFNESNRDFDYRAGNAGLNIGLQGQF